MTTSRSDQGRRRGGSFLLLASGILIVIVLFSAQYHQYMVMQKRLTSRSGEHHIMARLAFALATLAVHKLHYAPLNGHNSGLGTTFPADAPSLLPLYQNLTRPLAAMTDVIDQPLDLGEVPTMDLSPLVEPMQTALQEKGRFSHEIFYTCKGGDFAPCGLHDSGYPREKRGLVRLRVKLTFAKAGGGGAFTEEFRFACRVKVAATLAPVLSKFTLYVERAIPDGPEPFVDLNQVSVNANGTWCGTRQTARPIVLNNDGRQGLPLPTTFAGLTRDRRGLVYLGGTGTVILNMARGDSGTPSADSGEAFHSYRRAGWDGFIPIHPDLPCTRTHQVVVAQMEQGASDDPDPANKSWYNAIDGGSLGRSLVEAFRLKYASVFRLCGVDGDRSPTLVLGHVKSNFLLIRMAKTRPPLAPNGKKLLHLNYTLPDPAPHYKDEINAGFLKILATDYGLTDAPLPDYVDYTFKYGSFIGSRSYNLGLGYMRTPAEPDPFTAVPPGDPLYQLMQNDPPPDLCHRIPPPWDTLIPGTTDLKDLHRLTRGFADTDRIVYRLPGEGETDLWQALERRGLMVQGRLALNGWVFIRKPFTLSIDRDREFLAHGGIIQEEGDIVIRAALKPAEAPSRRQSLLYLVALNGNVRIEVPAETPVQAAIVAVGATPAAGMVTFSGGPASMTGALAMQRLVPSPAGLSTFAGPKLTYLPSLAAIPGSDAEASSEKDLLTCHFEPVPFLLR